MAIRFKLVTAGGRKPNRKVRRDNKVDRCQIHCGRDLSGRRSVLLPSWLHLHASLHLWALLQFLTETGAKTQDRDSIDPVCVRVVALAGTEVNMELRQCTMCMCEANHEEKEQRLTASGAS